MDDFEVRYNAMEQANLLMTQRLILEIAIMKGDEGSTWIDRFRNAVVSEIGDTKGIDGNPRPVAMTSMARSVVEGVAKMAQTRLTQLKEEGGL